MMVSFFDLSAAEALAYEGVLGAEYSPEKTVFRVWQPFAERAAVRIFDGERLVGTLPMTRVDGVFECAVCGVRDGMLYTFLITRGGVTAESPDPYSKAVSKDGERSVVVDMNAHKPDGWDNISAVKSDTPVIYELSVRDFSMDKCANFTNRGKFAAFCEENVTNSNGDFVGLQYIKSLGVTHIQLMPVFEFELDGGAYNWGYNPAFYNAPSVWYTKEDPVRELRELVAAAHKKGLGVVADVVYNHLYSADNSAFGRIFPRYFFRESKNGGYSNGSGCGNEFASERKAARKFIIDSLIFLAREYKFDGFRFDLMGLLDIRTLKAAERRLRKLNPNILLYGEGWTGGVSALSETRRAVQKNASRLPGFAFFNDSFRDAVKGSVFNDKDTGFVSGSADEYHAAPIIHALTGVFPEDFWADEPSQTVNYVECHDNLTLYDKLKVSADDPTGIVLFDRMAAALVLLSRGIAFIQAGQEFLRTKSGEHNSYNKPDSVNSIKWDFAAKNKNTVEYYRGLIALRRRFLSGLKPLCTTVLKQGFMIEYLHPEGEFVLIANPSPNERVTAALSGKFEVYADFARASAEPLYRADELCCEPRSIIFAGRIIYE